MKTKTTFVLSLVIGVLITLFTGLLENMPQRLVGAIHYGYPLAWRVVVVYLGLPTTVDPVALVGDIVFWTVLAFIILFLATRKRTK